MKKDAALTIRVPLDLKRKLVTRARRERRSLSAQVEHELERALAAERPPSGRGGKLLGRYSGCRVPTDAEIAEVRALLWGRLGRD